MNSQQGLGPHQAAALQEFASAVRDLLGSRLIALKLFGSQVRGEAAPDSDLDVLVAVEEASPALENAILDLAFQANLAHDVYISPRVIARQVFEDPVWGSTPFIRTLQAEGAGSTLRTVAPPRDDRRRRPNGIGEGECSGPEAGRQREAPATIRTSASPPRLGHRTDSHTLTSHWLS